MIAATYYYDAFGNILDQTGTATSNILYAGYQYDPETGLYYLNARMYDPVTARFIQEDSYLGSRNDVLSLNLYTYCHNEPMMYSDPTGHKESAPKGSTGGMPSDVYNRMYGYKPGEATAEYYTEKKKEEKKGLTEKAISSGKGGMPTLVSKMQEDLAVINEYLKPLPKTDQIAISKIIWSADEPYRTAMIESIGSGNFKLVDTSGLPATELKWYYTTGVMGVDFTDLKYGYYPYISFFHELGHAIDNNGKNGKDSQNMDLTTIVQDETERLLYNQIAYANLQYLQSGNVDSAYLNLVAAAPFVNQEIINSIYNNVNDPKNNDVVISMPLTDRENEILTIAASNMSYLRTKNEFSAVWDMMSAVTNTYTFTDANGQIVRLGGGHGVDTTLDPGQLEGFYYYSYQNGDANGPLLLNDCPGNEFFAEYFSTRVSGSDVWNEALQSTLPISSATIDSYLKQQYCT